MLGLIIISYIAIIIVYQMPTYYKEISKTEQIEVVGFKFDWGVFSTFAFTVYLFLN
jgi:hypothetical protein